MILKKYPKLTPAQGYGLVFVSFATIYGWSCAPGLLWQDSGLIQYRVLHHDVHGFFGLALAHPLYYWIAFMAQAIPFSNVFHKVNLISALAGAITVANVFLFMRLWLGKVWPAILAAASLGVSHTFWRHASIAETYTLWAMFFSFELIVLCLHIKTQKTMFLYMLAAINGLAVSVHMLGCLSAVCYLGYGLSLLKTNRICIHKIAFTMLIWLIGTLPFSFLIVQAMVRSHDISGTLLSAAFGDRWQDDVLNTAMTWRIARENCLFIILNYPTANIGLFFIGLSGVFLKHRRGPMVTVIAALASLFLLFAWRYTVADRYAFFIPFYCLMAVFMGKGLYELMCQTANPWLVRVVMAFALCPIVVYAVVPKVLKQQGMTLGTRQNIPYRDDLTYFLQPWKTGYKGADRFAKEVFEQLDEHAVLYADNTTVAPLVLYQESHGIRPDVHVVSAVISTPGSPEFKETTFDQLLKTRPIYVVSDRVGYTPSFLQKNYDMRQQGHVFQVIKPD